MGIKEEKLVVTLLTQSTGILGPIVSLLGLIMNGIYNFFHMFGVQNIALTIIVFTFITKILMLPLNIKQQKSSKLTSKMNPELQKITAKYKGKTDEASMKKQRAETQAVYDKYGTNMTAGCLPMLITLPIMFALYRVIYNIPGYVTQVYDLYEPIANAILQTNGYEATFTELAKTLAVKAENFNVQTIIDVLAKFKANNWQELMNNQAFADIVPVVNANLPAINEVNTFMKIGSFQGFNITENPGLKFPALLIPILSMVLNFVQTKQIQVKTQDNKDNPAASMMGSMNIVMPIMSGIFCISFPIGVGIYWIAQSVFTIIQQFFVNKYMDKIDIDQMIEKNVSKASKKKQKMTKLIGAASIEELAKKQTKSIETANKTNEVVASDKEEVSESNSVEKKQSNGSYNANSISEIANLLKNKSNEKGDK